VFIAHLFSKFNFNSVSSNNELVKLVKAFIDNGVIGVYIFFVLSGFLITFLLIKENSKNGGINIFNFYIRRILRIWPLYYLILISGIFIFPLFANTFYFDSSIWKNLIFLNNFDMAKQGLNTGIAWSIAIEEQFYLFWPLLFYLFYKRKKLIIVSFLIFGLSYLFIHYYPNQGRFHTFGNLNYLMAGCIGAIFYYNYKKTIATFLKSKIVFFLNLVIMISLIVGKHYSDFKIDNLILPFNYLILILHLAENNNTRDNKLRALGKYTYGMYFYHPIFLILMKIIFTKLSLNYENNIFILLTLGAIALFLTINFSKLSYNLFEKRFLSLKSKFV
jgi:peptidoglycan/LPS O-acetylase OafA/YrhL